MNVIGSASDGTQDLDAEATAKGDAPLPLLGLFLDYYLTPRWTFGGRVEAFALELDDETFSFSGSIANVRLHTQYWIFNNFGLGAAVNWFKIDVDVDDEDWKGTVDYEYFGPQLYLTARF